MAYSATTAVTIVAGTIAFLFVLIYFFGVPPELKRKAEEQALKTMGENKGTLLPLVPVDKAGKTDERTASYLVKDQISKVPASDQQDVKDLKKGLGNALGGAVNNPAGKEGGDLGDKLTSPFTGR
jgi:hypothetical protein